MSTLFDKRERAAESLFAHGEEARFLARRRAISSLAAWAGESMGLDAAGQAAYVTQVVDRFVSGMPEDQLVPAVQTDLERAGKPALSGQVGAVLAQATAAEASAASGKAGAVTAAPEDPHEQFARRHPKSHPWSL